MKYFTRIWKLSLITLALGTTACMGGYKNRGEFSPQTTEQRQIPSRQDVPTLATRPSGETTAPQIRVALLLPLTGTASDLGKSLLDASLLAMQDKYSAAQNSGAERIILIPKDTGGTVNGAIKATQEAIREKVDLILGPVFSKSLRAIAPLVQNNGSAAPIITFSNDRAIAGNGIYLMGMSPEQQIKRITSHAAKNGMQRFAAFLPNDLYGMTVAAAFEQQVRTLGKQLDRIIYYQAGGVPTDAEVRRLVDATETADGEAILRPNFDALLLPQGGQALQMATTALSTVGVTSDTAMFLGSGQWDDAYTMSIKEVQGGVFATAMPATGKTFAEHFKRYYGYSPMRLASLSYDATALAISLSSLNPDGKITSADLITSSGFSGPADGIFRFLPDGTTERGLAVMKVSPYELQIVEPAPTAF